MSVLSHATNVKISFAVPKEQVYSLPAAWFTFAENDAVAPVTTYTNVDTV